MKFMICRLEDNLCESMREYERIQQEEQMARFKQRLRITQLEDQIYQLKRNMHKNPRNRLMLISLEKELKRLIYQ